MTDKQIIIDGVDVSECGNLLQGIVPFGCMEDKKTCSCMNNPNCLYKQLKRKEQEFDQLKAENDELKEKVKELRQGWINCDNERNLQEANSEFNQRVADRYEQTLTEIEEIAINMNISCFYNDFDCEDCDMKNGCTYQGKITILQKISKCEGTNE